MTGKLNLPLVGDKYVSIPDVSVDKTGPVQFLDGFPKHVCWMLHGALPGHGALKKFHDHHYPPARGARVLRALTITHLHEHVVQDPDPNPPAREVTGV